MTEVKHKHPPRQCTLRDIAQPKNEDDDISDMEAKCNPYLSHFAAPIIIDGKRYCFHCGSQMNGFLQALGLGGAGYAWGIVHGEAHCSNCRWPARGMHYIKDGDTEVLNIRSLFLEYMPENVSRKPSS